MLHTSGSVASVIYSPPTFGTRLNKSLSHLAFGVQHILDQGFYFRTQIASVGLLSEQWFEAILVGDHRGFQGADPKITKRIPKIFVEATIQKAGGSQRSTFSHLLCLSAVTHFTANIG